MGILKNKVILQLWREPAAGSLYEYVKNPPAGTAAGHPVQPEGNTKPNMAKKKILWDHVQKSTGSQGIFFD